LGTQSGGYGAVATSSRSSPPRNAGGSGSPFVEDRYIDMEAEQAPAGDTSDVRLKWTKVTRTSPSAPSTPSPKRQHPPRLGPNSRTHSHDSRPDSSMSDSPPTHALARSPVNGSPRSDAVDLIVEDNELAEEEDMRERRRGEPAVRGSGLRKVFRRRYLPGENVGEEIEEVGEENLHTPSDNLAEVARTMGEVEAEEDSQTPRRMDVLSADGPVARVQTPPLYAITSPGSESDIENPWA
jgi:hypothetical protein